jgi:uncharacterized protein
MIDLDVLLDVQRHDTRADQVRHRRESLPERDELIRIASGLAELKSAEEEIAGRRHELARREKRFEDEAALVESKARAENDRLYSGTVANPKELQAIEAEIVSLKRRQTELEDEAIVLMEEIEPVDAELADLAARTAALVAAQNAARERLATGEAEAEAELTVVLEERAALAASLDASLLETYEKVRTQQQGVAVSRLVGNTCDGCHLGLSAVELDRVKHAPADVLVYHEECGRILVR